MDKGFYKMPKKNISVLVGLVLFAVVTYLPWTYGMSIANIGLIAWMMQALMFIAPLAALLLTIREKRIED